MAQFWNDNFWAEGFWVDGFWEGMGSGTDSHLFREGKTLLVFDSTGLKTDIINDVITEILHP